MDDAPDEFDAIAMQRYDDPEQRRSCAWALRTAAAEGRVLELADNETGYKGVTRLPDGRFVATI